MDNWNCSIYNTNIAALIIQIINLIPNDAGKIPYPSLQGALDYQVLIGALLISFQNVHDAAGSIDSKKINDGG